MPLLDYQEYIEKLVNPKQRLLDLKVNMTTVAYRLYSFWRTAPDNGVIPSSAEVCTRDTPGAIFVRHTESVQRITQIVCSLGQSGYIIISDRLAQSGGLSGDSIETQEINLPTPDLTRYTDGVGVMMGLEIYTLIGKVAGLATVIYIDDRGLTLTSPPIVIGGTGFNAVGRVLEVPLAEGSMGVKKVLSVTLDVSTGVVGNFGVTLYKPLFPMSIPNLGSQQFIFDPIIGGCGNMPKVENNACLFYLVRAFTSSTGILATTVRVMEE